MERWAQELKTDSVYHDFWLLRSSNNPQWTKPPESDMVARSDGVEGRNHGQNSCRDGCEMVGVLWPVFDPREARWEQKGAFLPWGSQLGWCPQLPSHCYLAYRTMMGGFAPRGKSERWKHEEEGKPVGTTQEFCRPQVVGAFSALPSPATLRLTLISSQALLYLPGPILFQEDALH